MSVQIEKTETKIRVKAPYNSIFVDGARQLAGKWSAPFWEFDIRDQLDVINLCMEVYGSDGERINQCDVQVTIPKDCRQVGGQQAPIVLFGRVIARAFGRDSGAKLGDGVLVKSGGFWSGGSVKNWTTTCQDNTVFVLRDVSRYLVDSHDNEAFQIEIISTNSNLGGANKAELITELEALERRKAEILELLSSESEDEGHAVYNDQGIHMELADD